MVSGGAYFKTLEDRSVMRPLAMGRFEDLLLADAKSPAMLYYLDNYTSTAEGPNEKLRPGNARAAIPSVSTAATPKTTSRKRRGF